MNWRRIAASLARGVAGYAAGCSSNREGWEKHADLRGFPAPPPAWLLAQGDEGTNSQDRAYDADFLGVSLSSAQHGLPVPRNRPTNSKLVGTSPKFEGA